jgi:predicted enzyme related to lactoylglutathione lyase
MRHAVNWFEIPSQNFERAVTFYDTIFASPLSRGEFMGIPHGFFSAGDNAIGAVIGSSAAPGQAGPLVYLNAADQLDAILARVPAAGGTVAQGKTAIGPQGHIAVIVDTEGNQLGLHQPPVAG